MIISKTPYRISFFGGGSDLPKWFKKKRGEVLSVTINRYCYVSLRHLPNFFKHNYRIVYSDIENVKAISNINHPPTKAALQKYKPKSLEIHYNGELPSSAGMGSSSSYTVGLINAIYAYQKQKIYKEKLAKEAINIERNILKEKGGYQDQIAAAYGGFNNITFNKSYFKVKKINTNEKIQQLETNLVLIYTGFKRISSNIQFSLENILYKKSSNIDELVNMASEGSKILRNKNSNIDDFGYLLNESWLIKKNLHEKITNSIIDEIYHNAIKNGALGGKILGAGNGGFMLFYVPKRVQQNFTKKLSKKYIISKVEFSYEGSKIVYHKD